ncbi:hypothetical protein ATE68_01385 [Sphingopyxis sp. H038]|uniref:hypothetical protein n=1 Tax=unclassified Sphingopyxis TaxID=2614943 RepID=UPI000730E5A1|nr:MULTISPECIES: hypothetical protein [unclassified Sphingopyxis]KTE04331.1 hypothetical protein ATE78_01385 [Sphingopyxis sp. H012]KTE10828.1 hypothetical protein ATE76_12955 [Sphingopyxis sp. H093]KTE13467.1 hypothetical protein ATE70_02040 [Sphingopyxis sp. H053]KTE25671.1 hypothetical protein ATE75_16335 [Sphingopyxis sp. H080]KTE36821.1 hypothetical protein ATE68_01385 [Sphingopyxis sp. H038]
MEPITAQINLRPLRVGFLVDPGNRAMLSRVMRLATCMWGGMMCPMIPAMQRVPRIWREEARGASGRAIGRGILRFFEPDIFVETAAGQAAAMGLDTSIYRDQKRYRSFASLVRKDIGLAADLDLGVSMAHLYDHFYRTEFQFERRHAPPVFDFAGGTPEAAAFFETAFGQFPKRRDLAYLRSIYRGALAAEEAEPGAGTWLDIMTRRADCPLQFTIRDIETRFDRRRDPAIFIFDPLSPHDAIDFWNFRIGKPDVVPVNANWIEQSRDLILRFVRASYRPLPTNPNGIMIDTTIHVGRSLDLEQVVKQLRLGEAGLPQDSVGLTRWYEAIWTQSDERQGLPPNRTILSVKSRDVQLTPSDGGRAAIRFPVQAPDFDAHQRGNGPSWVNALRIRQYGSDTLAVALPSAALGGRFGYPSHAPGDQYFTREGHVTFHHYASDEGYADLPKREEAIIAWLKTEKIAATPSEAGRIASQVIEAVGGLSRVQLLGERVVVELLDKMARSRRDWPDGSSDEYQDRTASVAKWTAALNQVCKGGRAGWKTLDSYVEAGVLKLGLTAACTHCGKENWYSLDDIAAVIACSRCLKSFAYPQGKPLRREIWKYRVVGPFATPHYAEGAYSVALTLHFLRNEIRSMSDFTYATGLDLDTGDAKLETDFFAWHGSDGIRHAQRDPDTFVGECKSLGSDVFKSKDIARLKALGAALPGAYLVAATLKDELSAEETDRLRKLAAWGWRKKIPSPVIVLTGIELFGEGPLSRIWQDAGGRRAEIMANHRHIFDFRTFADASQQACLGFSDEEVARMRYWRRRRR